ncbi:MAG: hypothetical protein AB1467_03460 [Candidatus Diapherotrites archaeon]
MNKKFFFSFLFLILIISSVNAFYASNAQYEIRGNIAQGGNSTTTGNYNLRFFVPEQPCGRAAGGGYELYLCYYLEAAVPPTQPLNVSLTANPNTGNDPLTTQLTASVTGGTSPYTYEWDYTSDGTIDDTTPPTNSVTDIKTRQYTPANTYTATVRARDSSVPQQNAQAQATIVVNAVIPVNRPPIVEADGPYSGQVNQDIVVNNATASDPDGDPLTYMWFLNPSSNCTASNSNTLNNFTVNCSTPGNRDATIVVQDGKGGVADDTATVNVLPIGPIPLSVQCTVSPTSGNLNQEFKAEVTQTTGGTAPYRYCFDWTGDNICEGPFRNDTEDEYEYSFPGYYTVSVQVRDRDGITASSVCGSIDVGSTSQNLLWLQKLTAVPMKAKLGEKITFTATVRNLSKTEEVKAKVRFYFTTEGSLPVQGTPEEIVGGPKIEPGETGEFKYEYTVNSPLQIKTNYFINAVVKDEDDKETADQLFDNERRKIFEVIEIRPVYAAELNEAIIPAILLIITIILLRK